MCDRDQKLKDVVDLTSKLLDEQLSDADSARLESMLFGDPEACELYLNVTTLHAHLTRELGGAPPVSIEPAGVPTIPHPLAPPPARRIWRSRFPWAIARYAAAASVLLFVGVVSVMAYIANSGPANACATLLELRDVAWAECSQPRLAGDRLEPQTIGLIRGTAVIRFDGGATATLSGPSELLIETRKSAELKSGAVLVRAEKESGGFTVRTAASDFVDLGTEFGVAINEDASSEVHVFQGVVIARPRASDVVLPILGNEAGRIEPDRGDIIAIDAKSGRFTGVTTVLPTSRPAGTTITRSVGPLPPEARVVFIGDRATDLETHLLLINQALKRIFPEGDRPELFNAGVSMPLAFEENDIRRHVLAYRPTHAVIEFGPEIAAGAGRRTVEQFEIEVRTLIDRLLDEGVDPIIATGFRLGERQAHGQGLLNDYNQVLRRLAASRGCRLADVDAHFKSLEKHKLSLVAPNGAVPTFSGSREMAQVVLAAMGFPASRADRSLQLSLLPGAITQWKYRAKPSAEKLTEQTVSHLPPDGWTDLLLPQPDDRFCSRVPDLSHLCNYRDRARGFATNLPRNADEWIEATATVESSEDITAVVNLGSAVQTVWLNGVRIYDGVGKHNRGMHAGAERIPVSLRAGPNHVVVEAAGSFFVSVTDEYDWPVQ